MCTSYLRFGMHFLDTYRFEAGKSCHRSSGETYGSVSAAKLACNQDSNCKMVANTRCDGKHFKTCMGPIIDSTLGSCVWNKGNNKKNYYQQVCLNFRSLIYINTYNNFLVSLLKTMHAAVR